MVTPSDRLRRILSDAQPAQEAPETGRPSMSERARRLRDRLDALGLGREPAVGPDDRHEGTWAGADDERPLEEQVEGRSRETLHGDFLYAERSVSLSTRHGGDLLVEALEQDVPLRPHERGATSRTRLDPSDALFLDTETTGLSGGTGTVAFLVGTGCVEGDRFVVRQYCMRDFPEEPAMLHALVEDVGDRPLVTFNGRCFDWPLLATRLSLHRIEAVPRAHLDLLPIARRLWVDSVPSHTLATLEEHVLGLAREGDLPGWRIPQAYFDFLSTGKPGLIALAFQHNEIDVLSMLSLLGKIGAILAAPSERRTATARDHAGTARLLLDMRDQGGARACLEAGIERAETQDALPLRRQLGHHLRRQGLHDDALHQWKTLARTSASFDVESFEQIAKIHEHRRHDYDTALAWVEEALLHVAPGSRAEEAFRHRGERLRRKQQRAREKRRKRKRTATGAPPSASRPAPS